MEKTSVLELLSADSKLTQLGSTVFATGEASSYGLYEGQRTLTMATVLHQRKENNGVILCDTQKRAKEIWEDLSSLLPETEVMYFPALEMIPYEVLAQSGEVEQKRVEILSRLMLNDNEKQIVVVTTAESISKKLLPREVFMEGLQELSVGTIKDPQNLREELLKFGYEHAERVEKVGQFSARGGIFDIFSAYYENPLRIEFFDDEVDSIRFFDIEDQCSIEKTQHAWITPAREFFLDEPYKTDGIGAIRAELNQQWDILSKKRDKSMAEYLRQKVEEVIVKLEQGIQFAGMEQYQSFFYPEATGLFNYIPGQFIVIMDEANRIEEAQGYLEKENRKSFSELLLKGHVLPSQESYFFQLSELATLIRAEKHINLSLLPKQSVFQKNENEIALDTYRTTDFMGNTQLMVEELGRWLEDGYAIVVLMTAEEKALRLQQLLADNDILAAWTGKQYNVSQGHIILAEGNISGGARFSDNKLLIFSETEILHQQKKHGKKKLFHENGQKIKHLDDLKIGDYVVHINHGIGRYMGLERLTVQNAEREYLIIKYADDGKLYIPVDQMNLLQKYMVQEGAIPKVNTLGGKDWAKTKARVKQSVAEIAEGLLALYAKRQTEEGFAFSPDDNWQREFEEAFPYVETEDQLRAIEEVKRDMMAPRVMDRLICGDVGYGKTEVAIRAAFKAVTDGKQVAVLVPTTILAQQHYNTFMERFSPYGVEVRMLSRFATQKEQRETIDGLGNGTVNVVIGTHKLLGKTIQFKDLGLLIIDEEQRFGVTHKEKIKNLRAQVDVLTLSATPIPRTLHMSLVGIRDMSVIETPPQDRYPIQTYIAERSPELMRDAIRRELGRNGQVYVVHNRVEDIQRIAQDLEQLVPEARIIVGHGQMKESELEDVMMAFIAHEADVLVCTTIIETGLDISNANTMIIDDADKMGLAQLYQLRGRVGRTNRVAYAYLMYHKNKVLSEVAEKRLAAVQEYTELGSGYKIAMRDLEIRGAGNLLGAEQSGHVASVGFDLYCELLDEAIRELKGERKKSRMDVEISILISAFIPEYYMRDTGTKLDFYQRIQECGSVRQLEQLEDEMVDRFGDIPQEVWNLIRVAELKQYCQQVGIRSLKEKNGVIQLLFSSETPLQITDLMALAKKYTKKVTLGNDVGELVVRVQVGATDAEEYMDFVKSVLLDLVSVVKA